MRLRISLQTRFLIWTTLLLIFLVTSILLVIEKREVNTILEKSKNEGILSAKNIAYFNLERVKWWDLDPIKRNIQQNINEKVIYVIFYDRGGRPLVANDTIKDFEKIYCCSRLPEGIQEEGYYSELKNVKFSDKIRKILEIEIPIFVEGSPAKWGSVKIGLSLEDMDAEIRKTWLVLILIGCGGLFFGMIGAMLLARRISLPIKKLADSTVKIAKGDFSHKLRIDSRDEIGNLAQSFNEMSENLLQTRKRIEEAQKRLIQAEKLASIGRISATIAHEIRNPLTSVKLNIQKVLQGDSLDEMEMEHLNISQEGILQIEKFIKELLSFTRVSELNLALFSLDQILEESLKLMRDSFLQKKICLEKKFESPLPEVMVDGDKLRQVFLNVLRNAFEAIDEEGKVRLSLFLNQENKTRKIQVKIEDNGCGIPDSDWENIFEPFYTTKASGFGLGLANARKIIEQHKGTIRVVKKRGRGTAFEILIPCEEGK
ncbi:MAG: ATP-binding protein [Candidatus Aminicenantales bacterium]